MGLRRRIKYQWQLFIPLALTMWVSLVLLVFWRNDIEHEYRKERMQEQLELINNGLIRAVQDPEFEHVPFLNFVSRYYKEHPVYNGVNISAYEDGQLIYNIGDTIRMTTCEDTARADVKTRHASDSEEAARSEKNFSYSKTVSDDGSLVIYTMLPFDESVIKAGATSQIVYVTLFIIAIAATIILYLWARYFGRNIEILRNLARTASTDVNDFVPTTEFPRNELGEISQQIYNLYNERTKAIHKLRYEHDVATRALQEKARLKRDMTNNINHEIKTPVGVIKGYIDTIIEHPEMDEASRRRFLLKAQEHANRLASLMADLSAITRLDEGGNMINVEEIEYHDLVFSTVNDLEESGAMKNMTFNYDIPVEVYVTGNYTLLSGMISNLTRNAVAYSHGTECSLVLVGEDEEFYHFAFYDNGVGVKEEHIAHLFERFYREDAGRSRRTGGTGLGLPIVLNTVEAHGGTITVANRKGGGLIFNYTLRKARTKNNNDMRK